MSQSRTTPATQHYYLCMVFAIALIGCNADPTSENADSTSALEIPTGQTTPKETLLKWRKASLEGDRKAFMECFFGIEKKILPAYTSTFTALETTHELERLVNERFGKDGWKDFLDLRIGGVAYRPIEIDAPWLSDEQWLKEVFFGPSEETSVQEVWIPQSRRPVELLPGEAEPGELAYYKMQVTAFNPLVLRKLDGAWYIEVSRISNAIDQARVAQSVREIKAFHNRIEANFENAIKALKDDPDIDMLKLKKIAFGIKDDK